MGSDEVFVFALVEDGVTPGLPPTAAALSAPSDQVSATPSTTVAGATPSTTVATGKTAVTTIPVTTTPVTTTKAK